MAIKVMAVAVITVEEMEAVTIVMTNPLAGAEVQHILL